MMAGRCDAPARDSSRTLVRITALDRKAAGRQAPQMSPFRRRIGVPESSHWKPRHLLII